MEYLSEQRVLLLYELPLAEVVFDFYDQLKSRTRGYASFDYDLAGFRAGELVRLDVLIGGEPVDALSMIAHRESAYSARQAARRATARGDPAADVRRRRPGRDRQQASSRARRSRPSARTCWRSATAATSRRKRKLLEKQKAGKKRMKQVGAVEIPQEAFLAVLNLDGSKK